MATPTYVALAIIFGILTVLLWSTLLRRRGQPFLESYAAMQVVFIYGLLVQQYSFDVRFETVLFAHLIFFLFFTTVVLTGIGGKRPAARSLLAVISRIPVGALVATGIAWFAFEVWLVARYGVSALAFARLSPNELLELELTFWEVMLSSALRMSFVGVIGIAVLRHAVGAQLGYIPIVLLSLVTIAFIAFGESPVGGRRLMLAMGALWFVTSSGITGAGLLRGSSRHWIAPALVVVGILGISIYYQSIRNNMADPDIAADVFSGDPGRMVFGVGRFLVPKGEDERPDVGFFRSGPLDFFIKVVDVRAYAGRSTGGEATALSLVLAVPKVLYPGEKPVGDVDDVLYERLQIVPDQPFFNIDYATSIAAIGMADYGIAGVLIGGVLVGVLFRLYWRALAATRRCPLVSIPLMGALVQLSASHEAALTSAVANARDAALFAALVLFLSLLIRAVRIMGGSAVTRLRPKAGVPSARAAK